MLGLLAVAGTPVTIELVALIAGVVTVIAVVAMFAVRMVRGSIKGLKDELMDAITGLRSDVDKRLDGINGKIDHLSLDHANHKVHVAEQYMSKASANIVFDKISSQLDTMGSKMDSRLMRIEDRLPPRKVS